jgi:hypothetical protein
MIVAFRSAKAASLIASFAEQKATLSVALPIHSQPGRSGGSRGGSVVARVGLAVTCRLQRDEPAGDHGLFRVLSRLVVNSPIADVGVRIVAVETFVSTRNVENGVSQNSATVLHTPTTAFLADASFARRMLDGLRDPMDLMGPIVNGFSCQRSITNHESPPENRRHFASLRCNAVGLDRADQSRQPGIRV